MILSLKDYIAAIKVDEALDSEYSFSKSIKLTYNFYYLIDLSSYIFVAAVSTMILVKCVGKVTYSLQNLIDFNTQLVKKLNRRKNVIEMIFEAKVTGIETLDDLNKAYIDFFDHVKERDICQRVVRMIQTLSPLSTKSSYKT